MARTLALGFTEVRHKIEVLRNIVAEGGSPKHVDLALVDSLDLDILRLYEDVAEQALRRSDGGGDAA